MLHKETQCRECELLSQHHEATKPKIKFPSKIKKKNQKKPRGVGVNTDLTYPEYINVNYDTDSS